MHDLAVHGEDGGEAGHTASGRRDAADDARDVLLAHAGAAQAHGRGVHLVSDGAGFLYLLYLAGGLDRALVDDRADEFQRRLLALAGGMDAGQVHEPDHLVVAVRRQEVYLAALETGAVHQLGQP